MNAEGPGPSEAPDSTHHGTALPLNSQGFSPLLSCFRNKYLLLNSQELNELSAISHKANIPEVDAVVNTDR